MPMQLLNNSKCNKINLMITAVFRTHGKIHKSSAMPGRTLHVYGKSGS